MLKLQEIYIEALKNGFARVVYQPNSSLKLTSLREEYEHLIKCRDKKYLELQIEKLGQMIHYEDIFNSNIKNARIPNTEKDNKLS